MVGFLHVCAFGDKQTCFTHLSTVLHLSHMGTSEQWAAKIQPFVFYPWAWNHIKAKQHASVGGKGFEPQGQGSSAEQRKASQEREGERGGVEERERTNVKATCAQCLLSLSLPLSTVQLPSTTIPAWGCLTTQHSQGPSLTHSLSFSRSPFQNSQSPE